MGLLVREFDPLPEVGAPRVAEESLKLLWWFFWAVKWGVNGHEIYHFLEDLFEVAHLVIHYVEVGIVAMQTEHSQFASKLLL